MRKVQFTAVLWTILLAVPFTILAIIASAFTSLHLFDMVAKIMQLMNEATYIGKPFLVEFFERMPELVGMVAGMLVMLAMLLLFRPVEKDQSKS